MTSEDIIRMAREAGCEETWGMDAFRFTIEELEKFFALAAAQEREACARVCNEVGATKGNSDFHFDMADWCAAAIRARGQA